MEHIAALLLIVGCSNGISQCRELPVDVSVFETAEQCDVDLPSWRDTFSGRYDRLFARCVAVDPALEEEDAELTWDVRPDGTLVASVQTVRPDVVMASNSRAEADEYPRQDSF